MFQYNGHLYWMVAIVPIYAVMTWYLTSDYASMELLGGLQAAVIPLILSSRVSLCGSM